MNKRAYSSRQEVQRYHREMDGLNWQFGGERMHYFFLHHSEFLPHAVIPRSGEILRFPEQSRSDIGTFVVENSLGPMSLDAYVEQAPVNGVIILQHGQVVYERTPRMRPEDKHLLMSVSKPFVSALIAKLSERGLIDVNCSPSSYLPELTESAWADSSIQDVLDMASGIGAPEEDEGFTNPQHPYYQYEASLGWLPATDQTQESTYSYIKGLRRKQPSGQAYAYTSVNTFLLAWLVEAITDLPLHEVIAAEIWRGMGAEADGLLSISRFSAPAAHGGICATLHDVARFGLLFTPSGRRLLPEAALSVETVRRIQTEGRPDIFLRGPTGIGIVHSLHGEIPRHNKDQWDFVLPDGDFYKNGYGGQGLYVSPGRDMVAAFFGTPFDAKMQAHELPWIIRQMVRGQVFDS